MNAIYIQCNKCKGIDITDQEDKWFCYKCKGLQKVTHITKEQFLEIAKKVKSAKTYKIIVDNINKAELENNKSPKG